MARSVWFEPNQGQVHRSVEFLARSSGGYVYFGRDRMAMGDVRMQLVGASGKAQVQFEQPTGGISSYFIGRNARHRRFVYRLPSHDSAMVLMAAGCQLYVMNDPFV